MNSQEILAACSLFIALLGLYLTFYINKNIFNKGVKYMIIAAIFFIGLVFIYTLSLNLFNNTSEPAINISAMDRTNQKEVNLPPTINSLVSNGSDPIEPGTTIQWSASGSDPDNDKIQYKFILDGKPKTNWLDAPFWSWTTSSSDIGSHIIEVKARDGKHDLEGDAFETRAFIIEASSKNSEIISSSSTGIGYTKTNEYVENGVEPICAPGSKQSTCSSPDSCVDCKGECWSPGSYSSDSGTMVCSEGKWTLNGYPRTNEYSKNSLMPNCTPGSKQSICSSPNSCVDCYGECWLPGSYKSGTIKCSQGRWTIIGYPRVNEYASNSNEPICKPGSKQAICASWDSCVDCKDKCWSPGSYNSDSGTMRCSQGKWILA